jgi:flagellar motor protein MotB
VNSAPPYKGLVPYGEADAALFFGRDRERELIAANLMAARLTVLYGPSGVGKTSVLHAGVIHDLRRQALQNFNDFGAPEFAVVAMSLWSGDPIASIEVAVHEGALAALGAGAGAGAAPASGDLVQTLRTWGERLNGELLVVLDQFEEYFLYHHGSAADERFITQFSRAVTDVSVPARFLISLREDALAQLDRFKGHIPGLFDNYLRIDRLDRAAARRAIEGPLEQLNADEPGGTALTLEPGLVDEVLDQVQTGRVTFGRGGAGEGAGPQRANAAEAEARVDTPYLQLVMQRLWQEDSAAGATQLRRATLARLGGADRIVRTHLDSVMATLPADVCETALAVFHHLVTPSGMKIAHSAADLAQYTGHAEPQVQRLLDALSSGQARVLRPVASADEAAPRRYEIHHDVLAAAILDWRQRYVQDSVIAKARRAQLRTRKILGSVVAVLLVFVLQFGLSASRSADAVAVQDRLASVRLPREAQQAAPPNAAPSPLLQRLVPDIQAGLLDVRESADRTLITLRADGLFEPGSAVLDVSREAILDRLRDALGQTAGRVLVTGHTDNQPIGTLFPRSRWQLSQDRASAVRDLLAGSKSDRFRAEGRADSEPVAANDTPGDRARNRRIEINVFVEAHK